MIHEKKINIEQAKMLFRNFSFWLVEQNTHAR